MNSKRDILFFVFALTLPMAIMAKDLTDITWEHAVNDQSKLSNALTKNVDMLEADVIIGNETDSTNTIVNVSIPIMGHPPANTSNLSLEKFIDIVSKHNKNATKKIGIKLDFKSIEALEKSIPLISSKLKNVDFEVWLNADILQGPVDSKTTPVDAKRFFENTKSIDNITLSIGWTTAWGADMKEGSYSAANTKAMLDAIKMNDVKTKITFPVRAGIAANSLDELHKLLKDTDEFQVSTTTTFTIWTADGDYIDIAKLKEFLNKAGVEKVYLDVPDSIKNQIKNSAYRIATTSLTFIATIVVAVFLNSF